MRTAYHEQLNALTNQLAEMCRMAGIAMERATQALLQADEKERPTVPWTKRTLAGLYRRVGRSEQAMGAEIAKIETHKAA